jgi:hypothetical protein
MSFNTQLQQVLSGSLNNPVVNTSTTNVKGPHTGTLPSQPQLVYQTKTPVVQVFLKVPYNTSQQLNSDLEAVTTIGLTQIMFTNVGIGSNTPLAIVFDTDSSNSLSTKTVHNLSSVPRNSLFAYYPNAADKLCVASFGGEPVIVWQKRGSEDVRHVRFRLQDLNGNNVTYDNCFVWMVASTHLWQ